MLWSFSLCSVKQVGVEVWKCTNGPVLLQPQPQPLGAGDMDLDPETGQYRLSAVVPGVEINALRSTLGVRPLPMPIAGALRGTLNCTGPLEEPLFSGEPLP